MLELYRPAEALDRVRKAIVKQVEIIVLVTVLFWQSLWS